MVYKQFWQLYQTLIFKLSQALDDDQSRWLVVKFNHLLYLPVNRQAKSAINWKMTETHLIPFRDPSSFQAYPSLKKKLP